MIVIIDIAVVVRPLFYFYVNQIRKLMKMMNFGECGLCTRRRAYLYSFLQFMHASHILNSLYTRIFFLIKAVKTLVYNNILYFSNNIIKYMLCIIKMYMFVSINKFLNKYLFSIRYPFQSLIFTSNFCWSISFIDSSY